MEGQVEFVIAVGVRVGVSYIGGGGAGVAIG